MPKMTELQSPNGVLEAVADVKDLSRNNSAIFETENMKCSPCITTKCIYKLIMSLVVCGVIVFGIIYLKK
jgi:hypothetical protein